MRPSFTARPFATAGLAGAVLAATLAAAPAFAAEPERPLRGRDPNVVDVAKTPVNDLNIGRDDEIPAILVTAVEKPYALDGLSRCTALTAEIERLDAVLGPDLDLPQAERDRISGGRVAKWVVASFIPFRGLIREISGANDQDRRVQAAIQAGLTRRGFLKGVGAQRRCKYPASPATAEIVQARLDAIEADKAKKAKDADKADVKADSKAGSSSEKDKSRR